MVVRRVARPLLYLGVVVVVDVSATRVMATLPGADGATYAVTARAAPDAIGVVPYRASTVRATVSPGVSVVMTALVALERRGIDLRAAAAVLGGGLAGSAVLELKQDKLVDREYSLGGSARNQLKDLRHAAAALGGDRAPVTRLAQNLFISAPAIAQRAGVCLHWVEHHRFV